ncbi:unnamed protein product [Vicia faba]|uniref:Uncharacterized protein n=1 Tax=Vicia faba TaxID=3906 RepID=A0AAV1ACP1_VICFA|nr:unnamed protein product [Vicia faba]
MCALFKREYGKGDGGFVERILSKPLSFTIWRYLLIACFDSGISLFRLFESFHSDYALEYAYGAHKYSSTGIFEGYFSILSFRLPVFIIAESGLSFRFELFRYLVFVSALNRSAI